METNCILLCIGKTNKLIMRGLMFDLDYSANLDYVCATGCLTETTYVPYLYLKFEISLKCSIHTQQSCDAKPDISSIIHVHPYHD